MKKCKKIISILMLIMIFLSSFQSIILGATQISKADLIGDHDLVTNVEFYDGTAWNDLEGKYICYTVNGNKYPAYCVSHGLEGVDEVGDYTVDITGLLSDVRIWRTIINGYPYKTPSQLGLNNIDEAYLATKQAIYCVILNRDTNLYRGKNTSGDNVVNVIKKLKDIGLNGSQGFPNPNLKINKSGSFVEDGNYYSQTYSVSASVDISTFEIEKITGFPEGSFVADSSGNAKTYFMSGQKFKVMVPKSKITKNINGIIYANANCRTYPILYRKNKNSRYTRLCSNL